MAQIWGIGERKFGENFDRRIMILFNIMVKSIMLYGVEIWGWREWREVEALQERYIRWILGLDKCTPGYIVREEPTIEKISLEAGGRAIRYQDRVKNESENAILKECRREMDKIDRESTNWGKTMEELYEAGGTSRWEREAKEEKGINTVEEWMEKYKEKQLEERKNKIEKSVLAKEYKRWKGVGRAKYLGQKGKGKRLKI